MYFSRIHRCLISQNLLIFGGWELGGVYLAFFPSLHGVWRGVEIFHSVLDRSSFWTLAIWTDRGGELGGFFVFWVTFSIV